MSENTIDISIIRDKKKENEENTQIIEKLIMISHSMEEEINDEKVPL